MTTSIADLFSHHHRDCDSAFALAEEKAQAADWQGAALCFSNFVNLLELHLGAEEERLFPAFELATGMSGGPPAVMRREHAQMRGLVEQASAALGRSDSDEFCGACETLNIMMQQHNMKEEHMLYPACDRALAEDAGLLDALRKQLGA